MFSNTYILLIVLLLSALAMVLRNLYHKLSDKVNIYTVNKGGVSTMIGILDYSANTDGSETDGKEAAVVNVVGASFGTPYIGKVMVDNTGKAVVSVLDSDLEMESENPFYRTYGYLDAEGYVHEIVKGRDTKIGFLAQPSNPNVPTLKGEWHWYSFWKRRLNAYVGKPMPVQEKKKKDDKKEDKTEENDRKKQEQPAMVGAKPVLAAECVRDGIHFGHEDYPSEARACAYALFFNKKRSNNNYSEYYNNPSHLWNDTALLASVVYSIIYLTLYAVNELLLEIPLFGKDLSGILALSGFYFIIWAFVRELKIARAQLSSSIKPQIDLLNKNIGIRLTDRVIKVLAGLLITIFISIYKFRASFEEMPFMNQFMDMFDSFIFYSFDFLPLVIAIFLGVTINGRQKPVPLPWTIRTGMADNPDDAGSDVVRNPKGKIDVTYDWNLDSFCNATLHGQVTLHFDKEEYIDLLRIDNPYRPQVLDHISEQTIYDMFRYLHVKPQTLERLRYLGFYMKDMATRCQLSSIDRMQFVLDFVQEPNIQYRDVHASKSLDFPINYMRFPDETLFDKEGSCECKAFLASMLFYEMGYDVVFLYSERYKTSAVAVELSMRDWKQYFSNDSYNDVVCELNGRRYLYCDVVSDAFKIGFIDEGRSVADFDMKVPFVHDVEDGAEREDDAEKDFDSALPLSEDKDTTFEWQLDSYFGTALEGALNLHFDESVIEQYREANPFVTYGADGQALEEKVREMYAYMRGHEAANANLKKLAEYIRHTTSEAGISEADTLQFILDFVQEPNIKYSFDADNASIGHAKMYVRFPEETLYDKTGDCDCKTMLASMLFKECGFTTLFLISTVYEHAALAVKCSSELLNALMAVTNNLATFVYKGSAYLFCETTGDGFKLGMIEDGKSADEFEYKIEVY